MSVLTWENLEIKSDYPINGQLDDVKMFWSRKVVTEEYNLKGLCCKD